LGTHSSTPTRQVSVISRVFRRLKYIIAGGVLIAVALGCG
jgi:hypothetical protein